MSKRSILTSAIVAAGLAAGVIFWRAARRPDLSGAVPDDVDRAIAEGVAIAARLQSDVSEPHE